MRTFYLLVAIASGLATSSALAETSEVANKDKPAAVKVCREVIKTGSIMPGRKECHTRSEWLRIDDKNHDNAQNATDRNRGRLMPARQDLDR